MRELTTGNTDMIVSRCFVKQFRLSQRLTEISKWLIHLNSSLHSHNGSRDESDSRYKVPTFHIIFYSLQRRWAGQAGSCKEGGICNGLWGLIWSNRNRKYEMEISPHWGQSHTVSWGKTNPAIIFQLLTTQPGWVALVTQHRGIILPCSCCAL